MSAAPNPPTICACVQTVSRITGIPYEHIIGAGRRSGRSLGRPRQLAMWLAHKVTGKSLGQIGLVMDRDHTMVMYAIRRIDTLRDEGDRKMIEWSDAALRQVMADPRQVEMAL